MPLTLTAVSEASKTLTAVAETGIGGFFPGTALYRAPYPFFGSTSYFGSGRIVVPLTEDTKTLTALTEA